MNQQLNNRPMHCVGYERKRLSWGQEVEEMMTGWVRKVLLVMHLMEAGVPKLH